MKFPFIALTIILGAFAIAMDFASIDLALPALEEQFNLDLQSVQWVINGYVLAFAVLMVTGGKLADAYGRRRVFLIGATVFTVASLLGGAAWSGGSIITFRVLQGVGAAMFWPAMIGMACGAAGDARRALVMGLIFGSCSLGNAAGPVVGGALTEWFSWRWVLWINVPMTLAAIGMTLLSVRPDHPGGDRPSNDFPGMIALTGGLIALMFVIYQGSGWGWFDIRTLGLAVAGIALLGAFPWIEKRAADPLIPTDLMRNREMQVLCLAVMVICEMFFVVLLYFTQFAMKFLGQDPISAGARVIPFMLSYGIVSYCGAQLTAWLGTRRLLLGGMACGALAATLIAWVGPDGDWPLFYGSLILLGIGVGAVIPTVSARAIETAGSERAGLATGITFMAQLAGSAALLVVYTAIFRATSRSSINAQLQSADVTLTGEEEVAVSHLVSGGGTIHGLPRSTSDAIPDLAAIVQTGYEHGLAIVMFLCGASALVTLVLMWRVLPRNLPPTNNIST